MNTRFTNLNTTKGNGLSTGMGDGLRGSDSKGGLTQVHSWRSDF